MDEKNNKQKTAALKKKLVEKATSMDPVKVREAKKKIRRVQRRRRSVDVRAKRLAGKDEGAKTESSAVRASRPGSLRESSPRFPARAGS